MGQSTNEWIWDAHLASPADFAGADDIITTLAKDKSLGSRSSNALIWLLLVISLMNSCQNISISIIFSIDWSIQNNCLLLAS